MFGNCEEKIPVISSNTNEWPLQNNEKSFKGMIMASSSSSTTSSSRNILMDKTQQQQQPNLQQPLNCPRCDSSNTKFCYYNNYSLSQPRHFCKACKRYWTRGGTLRNVPVGGGCRKNKRVKRTVSSSSTSSSFDISSHNNNSSSSTTTTSCATNPNPQNMSHYMNPLFYGLSDVGSAFNTGPPEPTQLKFLQTGSGYGLNALGLGFSRNLGQPNFSSSIPCSLTPSMSSLLSSGAQNQQKLGTNNQTLGQNYHLQTLASFQDLQVGGNNSGFSESATGMMNNQDHHHQGTTTRNMNNQMMDGNIGLSPSSLDPGSVYSNWLDPSNYIGSSLTSLI